MLSINVLTTMIWWFFPLLFQNILLREWIAAILKIDTKHDGVKWYCYLTRNSEYSLSYFLLVWVTNGIVDGMIN